MSATPFCAEKRYYGERAFQLAETRGDILTEQAYTDAVLRNSQRIFLLALSFTRQRDDAEDVTQNVLLKLWKHRDKLRDPLHTDKWLTRVTVNECHSLLRFRRESVSYEEIEALCAAPETPEEQGLIYAVLRLPKETCVFSLVFRTHLEHQFAAGHDVGVTYFPVSDRLAVERH